MTRPRPQCFIKAKRGDKSRAHMTVSRHTQGELSWRKMFKHQRTICLTLKSFSIKWNIHIVLVIKQSHGFEPPSIREGKFSNWSGHERCLDCVDGGERKSFQFSQIFSALQFFFFLQLFNYSDDKKGGQKGLPSIINNIFSSFSYKKKTFLILNLKFASQIRRIN